MYETLVAALRNVNEYDSGYAKLMYDAADAIEAQDRHILTLQHEMMAEAESHTALVERLNKQIERLAKNSQKVDNGFGEWIPVTERLPEDLARVIVFCNDGVFFGFCEHLIVDDKEVVEWNDFLHYPIRPTHWMPLPSPPVEES